MEYGEFPPEIPFTQNAQTTGKLDPEKNVRHTDPHTSDAEVHFPGLKILKAQRNVWLRVMVASVQPAHRWVRTAKKHTSGLI